jgi:histidine triad (HIT) family protein
MMELPVREPYDLCVALREEPWKIIDACEHTVTLINPRQFEVGQCCVVTRRHVATLLDLSPEECSAVMMPVARQVPPVGWTKTGSAPRACTFQPRN